MKGWRKIKIEDLGKVVTGNTPPRKNPELYGSHTLFIKPTDVSEDTRYTLNPEECYSELGYKKYIKSLIPKGSTCVVTIGSIGKKITQAHCDCFINQAMNAVIPNKNFDPNFVYYLLKHNLHSVKALDSGTASGRENVSKSSFSSIELFVPNELETQIEIGNKLSVIDDLIENNSKRIKLLEETTQITFEEWIMRFNPNGQKLKTNKVTGLPVGWERKKLNEMAELVSGFAFKSSDYVKDGKNKIVTIKNVQDGFFVPIVTDTLYSIPTKVKEKHHLKTGDIILSLTGNVGRVCLVFGQNYLLNQRVAKIVPKARKNFGFIYTWLRNKNTLLNLENLSNGAAQQNPSPVDMGNMEMIVPSEDILNSFSKVVNPLLELVCNLYNQNSLLKESLEVLLPQIMAGKITVGAAEKKVVSISQPQQKEATWEFKEAVLISLLTEKFGNEKFPLGRKRYTKLSYLFHRHADNQMQNYLRKAAGPYNPKTKYAGPEKIAHQNGYVADHKNGNLTGFIAGKNISAAKTYFENYWNIDYLNWLDTNFHYKSNDQLELYATVDNAMLELHEKNKTVNVEAVKQIIKTEKEWKAKLEREIFNDANIQKAITHLPTLFQYENS